MELHDFVRKTIEEVIAGVHGSLDHAEKHGAKVAVGNCYANIKFDVAVNTSDEDGKAGKIGVGWSFLAASGEGRTANKTGSEHRIRFTVNVVLPQSKTEPISDVDEPEMPPRRGGRF